MENLKPSPGKFAMNYGLILGAIMILISIAMYVTGMLLEGKEWPQYLYYIIFPVIIFYAIGQFKKTNANSLSFSEALKTGMVIAVISALVYAIYGLVFNYIIDPDFMGEMMKMAEEKIAEDPNMPVEMKEKSLEMAKTFSNPFIGSALWLALSAFFGLIWSAIAGLVMKTNSQD
ncbi:DUF4199 domain-containing protein [Hanstruepera flava]|uniref:DUF4199 domain-containing protein n=1 Tax=Hanstruepera flava TaxID=2930218 RepID=UPI002027E78A|nr:DUF4199 domain-containing protein [Hanstruepera flava]